MQAITVVKGAERSSRSRTILLNGKLYECELDETGREYIISIEFVRDVVDKWGNKVRSVRCRRRLGRKGATYRVVMDFFKEDFPEFFQEDM